ncbi:MAG: hypothetical protein ABJI96_01665 [Paracoccaceae bacterium]
MEEARALRQKVLAQREQGIVAESEISNPAKSSDSSAMIVDYELNGANEAASECHSGHRDPTTSVNLAADELDVKRVYLPRPRVGRVAERLALGLGIGLGIGASLYLGASLSGTRIGFVTSDAPVMAEQPQQTALNIEPVATSEIASPAQFSLVEPVASNINIPKESEQKVESSQSVLPDSVNSNYEMAPENESTDNTQQAQQGLSVIFPAPAIDASLASYELDAAPPSLLPEISDIVPSEALDPQLELALLPDQEFVNDLSAGPTASILAEEDVSAEPTGENMPSLAELDQRLPGADAYTVVLNVPSSLSDDEVASVTKGIVETGASIAKVDRVNFRISSTQIRFFRPDDAEPAAAIANRIGAEARDFTSYRPSPPVGTIEMFLSGGGSRSVESKIVQPAKEVPEQKKRSVRRYPSNDNR